MLCAASLAPSLIVGWGEANNLGGKNSYHMVLMMSPYVTDSRGPCTCLQAAAIKQSSTKLRLRLSSVVMLDIN